ncbi:glycosyltransferase family 2 protein [Pseudoalteromonas sp. HL-AS2]|uniref:glycosyltransferase family 2 protein n=1 Tax=Pseudoalteromonas sp. HL-AS2 TaxID=3071082 RepID=UPI002815091B|nr:glycosyltransferase family 2 protein [Pseudoalteromonas sp. HL-AS2]WMS94900.1 glycosyltransferase family 2 protein [Pseudoalteromonas sp. HL-AS2]
MKVTIGIPFFNAEDFLYESVKSILLQNYSNFELLLVDDGSTDRSLEIANSFRDSRIKVISDGINLGLPARLNQIIQIAKGDYIARMDADDLVALNRIQKQVTFLNENKDVDLVSTGICSIANDCSVMSIRLPSGAKRLDLTLKNGVQGSTEIAHATIMVRRKWYLRNLYDENAKLMEDYQLWLDALIKDDLKAGYIREPLYFYREESSIQFDKLIRAYKNQRNVIREKYKTTIPFGMRFSFYSKIELKILVTRLFNILGIMNKLISLRNKATPQSGQLYNLVNDEIDKIKNFKEHQ